MSNCCLFGEKDTPYELCNFTKKKYKTTNYNLLLDEINTLCKMYPNRAECYVLRGDIHKKLLEYDKSFENYKKAISCNPNNAAYYAIVGEEYFRTKKFDDAIEILTYLINNKKLKNYDYYVSIRVFRLLAACCIGDWDIAEEEIKLLRKDFIIYTKPVKGKIDYNRLVESIEKREKLEIDG